MSLRRLHQFSQFQSPQELFTREVPFHGARTERAIICRILTRLPNRPSNAATCSRMTDRWWKLCVSCWSLDPSLRPTISHIIQTIGKGVCFSTLCISHYRPNDSEDACSHKNSCEVVFCQDTPYAHILHRLRSKWTRY